MTKLELYEKERLIVSQYELQLHDLRMEYVKHNKVFEVGDFIHNLLSGKIIKIDSIKYNNNMGMISVMYCGYEYVYLQGQLLQNEYKEITCLTHDLEKIEL